MMLAQRIVTFDGLRLARLAEELMRVIDEASRLDRLPFSDSIEAARIDAMVDAKLGRIDMLMKHAVRA